MKQEEKKPTNWEVADPKLPPIQGEKSRTENSAEIHEGSNLWQYW